MIDELDNTDKLANAVLKTFSGIAENFSLSENFPLLKMNCCEH